MNGLEVKESQSVGDMRPSMHVGTCGRFSGTGIKIFAIWLTIVAVDACQAGTVKGVIVDSVTGQPCAARLYVRSSTGTYHLAQSADQAGGAVHYNVRRGTSVEVHTSLSAHAFVVDLPSGDYEFVVEKGKEYLTATKTVRIANDGQPMDLKIPIKRWIDMAAHGWYSGETHVHRKVSELPTLLLAEDLNVAFPLTAWVTDSLETPAANNKNTDRIPSPKLIEVDKTHVIWPVNTEYEIFSVRRKRHTLGAVFILNHRESLQLAAPPIGEITKEAKRQGAFLDLDKHNWPWSIMVAQQMKVDLFELSNNHVWRTDFLFKDWYPEYVGEHMKINMPNGHFSERGWIDFGFQTYYALLNCGFPMQPTAGTASGVHPVPLGFGRVYVKVDGDFSYQKWVAGLLAGNSFATTGPMLQVTVDPPDQGTVSVAGLLESANPPISIEVIRNGIPVSTIDPQPQQTEAGTYRFQFHESVKLDGSSWIAVRAFTRLPNQRVRFAHSAPVHLKVPGKPLRPTVQERDYLAKRIADEIVRNRGVLEGSAYREYTEAFKAINQLKTR